ARRCVECGRPVTGKKKWRCPEHAAAAAAEAIRRSAERHREERNRRQLARVRKETPKQRAHRLAVKKAWRERNWLKLKIEYQRKKRLSGTNGYKSRDRYLDYHRKYNAARAAEKREYMRAR